MQHIDRYLNYLLLWASNLSQIKEQFSLFRRFAVNGFLPNEIHPFTSYLLVHCVLRLTQSNLVAKNGRSLSLTHEPLLVLMREKLSNNQKGTYFRLHPLKLFFQSSIAAETRMDETVGSPWGSSAAPGLYSGRAPGDRLPQQQRVPGCSQLQRKHRINFLVYIQCQNPTHSCTKVLQNIFHSRITSLQS